jgi:hypothetical protein
MADTNETIQQARERYEAALMKNKGLRLEGNLYEGIVSAAKGAVPFGYMLPKQPIDEEFPTAETVGSLIGMLGQSWGVSKALDLGAESEALGKLGEFVRNTRTGHGLLYAAGGAAEGLMQTGRPIDIALGAGIGGAVGMLSKAYQLRKVVKAAKTNSGESVSTIRGSVRGWLGRRSKPSAVPERQVHVETAPDGTTIVQAGDTQHVIPPKPMNLDFEPPEQLPITDELDLSAPPPPKVEEPPAVETPAVEPPTVEEPPATTPPPEQQSGVAQRVEQAQANLGEGINAIPGNPAQIIVKHGDQTKEIASEYQLVDIRELQASHDPMSFKKNESYPADIQERSYHSDKAAQAKVIKHADPSEFKPGFWVTDNPDLTNGPPAVDRFGIVLGGNSRVMSLRRVYETGHGDQYRNFLKANADRFGFTPELVDQVENPILVRRVEVDPKDYVSFVHDFNKAPTQRLSTADQAIALGKQIDTHVVDVLAEHLQDEETLRKFFDQDRSIIFVRKLQERGIINTENYATLVDPITEKLSSEGKSMIEQALLGRVITNPDILTHTPGKFKEKIVRALPGILRAMHASEIKGLPDSLPEALTAAVTRRVWGKVGQTLMFPPEVSPLGEFLFRFVENHKPTEVREAFERYAHLVENQSATPEAGLNFLDELDPKDAFEEAFGIKRTDLEQYIKDNPDSALLRGAKKHAENQSRAGSALMRGGRKRSA